MLIPCLYIRRKKKSDIDLSAFILKKTPQVQNRYLGVLIDLSFQGIKRLFVLSFKDDDGRKSYKQHYLPTVEMKDYYVVIDRRNFFDRPITPYQK